jgi:DNA (cytosine-5)-methyltransferase 1
VLNSKDFGVPQNRERVFIVGHLRTERRPEVFPIGESNKEYNAMADRQENSATITSSYKKGYNRHNQLIQIGNIDTKGNNSIWGRVYSPDGVATNINSGGGGMGAKTGLYKNGNSIHRLTPIECCRLQGFPDNWTSKGIDKNGKEVLISDSQRYKCLGNAVTTKVIQAIGERLNK